MGTLTDLLISSGQKYADSIAIEAHDNRLIYQELLARSQQKSGWFANYYSADSKGIAICLPKSIDCYITLLSILFAGCYYIPIDYAECPARIIRLMQNAVTGMMITTKRKLLVLAEQQTELDLSAVVDLDSKDSVVVIMQPIDKEYLIKDVWPFSNLQAKGSHTKLPIIKPETWAYVLYTSGSTGQPKGIIHTHSSACAFIEWASVYLDLSPADRVAQYNLLSFDLSVFDIFAAFQSGATLVTVPSFFGRIKKICHFIECQHITIWYSVPSVLLRHAEMENWVSLKKSKLRHIIFAGEVISTAPLQKFVTQLNSAVSIHNWYGPTETNVCAYYKIKHDSITPNKPIPIGQPCPYSSFIIQQDKKLASSSLWIGGKSLMQGYLREGKVQRGVFKIHDNTEIYPSGDTVSLSPEKHFIFCGREDRQVKMGGVPHSARSDRVSFMCLSWDQ